MLTTLLQKTMLRSLHEPRDGLPDRDAEHGEETEVLKRSALALGGVAGRVARDVDEASEDPDGAGGGREARVVEARVEEAVRKFRRR